MRKTAYFICITLSAWVAGCGSEEFSDEEFSTQRDPARKKPRRDAGVEDAGLLQDAGTQDGGLLQDAGTQDGGPSDPIHQKIYVLVFDPVFGNGLKVHQNYGWGDPFVQANDIVSFFETASNGHVKFDITLSREVNAFPVKMDGFVYNESSYRDCIENRNCHAADLADYNRFLSDPSLDICGAFNRGEIHELWVFGGPYFGFYESALATSPSGPAGFPYNGGTFSQTACKKLMPILGENYERWHVNGHNFAHRMEATMARVYGGWSQNRLAHNWDRFGLVAAQSPSFGYSGCGSAHLPPNGRDHYDYGNTEFAQTFCDDFLSYPSLTANPASALRPISCSEWGCSEAGYFRWWYSHIPAIAGRGPDGKLNDWWRYMLDPNLVTN